MSRTLASPDGMRCVGNRRFTSSRWRLHSACAAGALRRYTALHGVTRRYTALHGVTARIPGSGAGCAVLAAAQEQNTQLALASIATCMGGAGPLLLVRSTRRNSAGARSGVVYGWLRHSGMLRSHSNLGAERCAPAGEESLPAIRCARCEPLRNGRHAMGSVRSRGGARGGGGATAGGRASVVHCRHVVVT